jgi:hypothetical protein
MSLDELQQKDIEYIKEGINDLKREMRLMSDTFVRQDVHRGLDEKMTDRVRKLEDSHTWLFRTVIATMFGFIVTIILTVLN